MTTSKQLLIIICAAITLGLAAGCGSSSSGGSGGDGEDTAEMVVTPSLGLIRDAVLGMYRTDGSAIDITTEVQPDGSIVVTYPSSVTSPVYIEIAGNAAATYFDEGVGAFVPFTAAHSFRTYMTSPQAAVGLTALTELASSILDTIPSITAALIAQANELVRAALAPSLASITNVPQVVGSPADLVALSANGAGEYAAVLATIAELAENAVSASPVPEIVAQLAADVQSGAINGMDASNSAIPGLIYDAVNFETDFASALSDVTTGTALQGTDFGAISTDIGVLDNGETGVDLRGTIDDRVGQMGQWTLFVDNVFENAGGIASGPITYNDSPVEEGSTYRVTSSNVNCVVSNGEGTVSGSEDVTNIDITCSDPEPDPQVDLSGTISNPDALSGQWELFVDSVFANDGGLGEGAVMYNFTSLANGQTYEVRVSNEDCSVTNATGTADNDTDVTDIDITCTEPSSGDEGDLSGTITNPNGLPGQWELIIGGFIANDGQLASGPVTYNFNPVANGQNYEVRVSNEECSVTNGTGTFSGGTDITNIDITCP